jgi:hypothetical protein
MWRSAFQIAHDTLVWQHAPKYPMFPCIETKVKWDEYGLLINPEEYSFAQENRNLDDV